MQNNIFEPIQYNSVKGENILRILFVGDIVGASGRYIAANLIPKIRNEENIDLVIANGENASGGMGLTKETARKLFHYKIDVITSGNHIWDKMYNLQEYMQENTNILRPINYPEGNPGRGYTLFTLPNNLKVGIINAQGRTFMQPIDCPFRTTQKVVEELRKETNIIFVDFHAEATSEKIALGFYLDGQISALVGTHTHVQTNDLKILPKGTAYLTDAGMCGALYSVIGMRPEESIHRYVMQTYKRFVPAKGDVIFNGVIIDIDIETGKAVGGKLVNIAEKYENNSSLNENGDNCDDKTEGEETEK